MLCFSFLAASLLLRSVFQFRLAFVVSSTSISMACQTTILKDIIIQKISTVLDIAISSIDYDLSFPALGGHSLSAVVLSSACKHQGISLSVEAILRCENISTLLDCASYLPSPFLSLNASPTDALLKCYSNHQLGHEAQLLPLASHSSEQVSETCLLLPPDQISLWNDTLTEMQLSLIYGSKIKPGTNVISFYSTYLSKDLPVIKQAWKTVIESEPIFRLKINFSLSGADIITQTTVPFHWAEVFTNSQKDYRTALDEQPPSAVGTSFKVVHLDGGLLGQSISAIIWRVHHALIDGYSASLVHQKVRQAAEGHPIQPGTSFFQVAKDLQALQQNSAAASKSFWQRQQLDHPLVAGELGFPPSLPLSPAISNSITECLTLEVAVDPLLLYAREQGVTLAALYYSAWALVLSRYTDSDSVVFGIVHSGRNLPLQGVEDTIGPLINTLPFYVVVDGTMSATEYILANFRHMIELGSMQFSLPEDGYSRQFSSAIAMEFPMDSVQRTAVEPVTPTFYTMSSDIPLSVSICADGKIRLCYHTEKYRPADMELLASQYRNALFALLKPKRTIEECIEDLLPDEFRKQLMRMGNCLSPTTSPSSVCDDLVTLFERAVTKYPDAIALEKGSEKLSYCKLNAATCQVSYSLSEYIQPGDVVCVHADRSINWIIAIYAILKAGGIYAPLDPALPSSARDSNASTTGCRLFLAPSVSEKKFRPKTCTFCFSIEEMLDGTLSVVPTHTRKEFPRRQYPRPDAPAYICFTSGSTGKPKAVLCSHEGLVAFQTDKEVRMFAEPGCRISQIMSPAFDGSIHEVFSALSYSATLILAESTHPFAHLGSATSAILTPSMAKILAPRDYPELRNVGCTLFSL